MSASRCVFESLDRERARTIQALLAAAGISYIIDHRTSFGKPIERAVNLVAPIRILVDAADLDRAQALVQKARKSDSPDHAPGRT